MHQNQCRSNLRSNLPGIDTASIYSEIFQECECKEARNELYFGVGGTYSFGNAEPSPKKNCSICLTITS
jgi:hypothetical protein